MESTVPLVNETKGRMARSVRISTTEHTSTVSVHLQMLLGTSLDLNRIPVPSSYSKLGANLSFLRKPDLQM